MLSAVLSIVLAFAGTAPAVQEAAAATLQARPVARWLKALKDGDVEQLKACFSERVRGEFEKVGWNNVMETYRAIFKKEFGDYTPEDFSFQFQGGESQGTVSISFRGKTLPGLAVIKEKEEWKLNER